MDASSNSPFSIPLEPTPPVAPTVPTPPLDLTLEVDDEPSELRSKELSTPPTLVERASQKDPQALSLWLQQELKSLGGQLIELTFCSDRLQMTWETVEASHLEAILPHLKQSLAALGLVAVRRVELYGQRSGDALPFWRTEFDLPSDVSSRPEIDPADAAEHQSAQEAVIALVQQYALGTRQFVGLNLQKAELRQLTLTLADLQAAQFNWSDLSGAVFSRANLRGAQFKHANLEQTNLRGANLQGADFAHANLQGADLSWSDLRGANLTGANLTNADLRNASLERVIMPDGTLLD